MIELPQLHDLGAEINFEEFFRNNFLKNCLAYFIQSLLLILLHLQNSLKSQVQVVMKNLKTY